MSFRRVKVRKDPQCPACGTREIRELVDDEETCAVPTPSSVSDLTALDLAAIRRTGEEPFLLDVREPHEWAIGRIEGAELIPLGELGRSFDRLPRDREIVVYCKGGLGALRRPNSWSKRVLAEFGIWWAGFSGGVGTWTLRSPATDRVPSRESR